MKLRIVSASRRLVPALGLVFGMMLAACDPGGTAAAPDAGESDTSEPSDAETATDTPFQAADIDLSLPDSGVGDRELRNGTTVWVGHVIDGDTAVVWVGDFAPARFTVRMVGLAAPECLKENRSTPDGTGQSCVSDDEIHGQAAFIGLQTMVEDKRVTITCEAAPGARCPKDTFGRTLGYLELDGKDAAVEMARLGNGLSYVSFYSSKRADICAAVYDARARKVGMWALGTETYVIGRMNADTRSWYNALHDKRCDEALGR